MRLPIAVLAFLLALPGAIASGLSGSARMPAGIAFPDGAQLDATAFGAFTDETRRVDVLTLESPRILVQAYEARYADVDAGGNHVGPRISASAATFELHDARVRLLNVGAGWLGLRLDGARLVTDLRPNAVVDAQAPRALGNGAADDGIERPTFHLDVASPSLAPRSVTRIEASGAGAMKWLGADVQIVAAENETTLRTGWARDGGPVAVLVERWAQITFEPGNLVVAGPSFDVALADARAAWDGAAVFAAQDARLASGEGPLDARSDAPIVLEGKLRATLVPAQGGVLGTFSGELASTTLIAAPPARRAWWPLAVIAAAALAGGWWLRARRRPPPDAEECVALASLAAEQDRYADAVRWIGRARRLSPTSLRLALDEAYYLEASGEAERAWAATQVACARDPSGDAHLFAARLLAARRREADATAYVAQALRASPALLLEVESDDALRGWRARPDARSVMDRARRELA